MIQIELWRSGDCRESVEITIKQFVIGPYIYNFVFLVCPGFILRTIIANLTLPMLVSVHAVSHRNSDEVLTRILGLLLLDLSSWPCCAESSYGQRPEGLL
jgi:hypothetical protein